jgi:hypothetical protein
MSLQPVWRQKNGSLHRVDEIFIRETWPNHPFLRTRYGDRIGIADRIMVMVRERQLFWAPAMRSDAIRPFRMPIWAGAMLLDVKGYTPIMV